MFYSHTILARKGPLGTVWFAAHLQHRLKKSHYTATDIPSTVDRIMVPEVPIALRMSAHLLLGVVRIYSKKVDYLHHDCNVVLTTLKKAFLSIDLSLPENAMQAQLHSITLPDNLSLDAVDFDLAFDDDRAHNDHQGYPKDITLTEQYPIATSPFVAIAFDKDTWREDQSHQFEIFDEHVTSMDVDVPPNTAQGTLSPVNPTNEQTIHNDKVNYPGFHEDSGASSLINEQRRQNDDFTIPDHPGTETHADFGHQDPGPSQHTKHLDTSPVPEIEILRHAVPDVDSESLLFPFSGGNDVPESLDRSTNNKASLSPIREGSTYSLEPSPVPHRVGTPASLASLSEGQPNFNSVSFGLKSTPRMEQPPTEQPVVEQPRPRKRKKQYFDDRVVLSNEFIGKTIKDASDLKRKRKKLPSSTLGIWKMNNVSRKEQTFQQLSLTGLCPDICNIYNQSYISTQSHLFEEALPGPSHTSASPTTEAVPEDRVAVSSPFPPLTTDVAPELGVGESAPVNEASPVDNGPESHLSFANTCEEIENFRGVQSEGVNNLPVSPRIRPPPLMTDVSTPPTSKRGSASDFSPESTGTRTLRTPGPTVSPRDIESETRTPTTPLRPEFTGPSEFLESTIADDLSFLDKDNCTPAGSQGTDKVYSLSVRARAVAQYLKSLSPEDLPSDLSLDTILNGKKRKLCARMFFETLVLKSHGLIDVKQEVPFGDIMLTVYVDSDSNPIKGSN